MQKYQVFVILVLQLIVFTLFGIFVDFGENPTSTSQVYPPFQDVHVMIFVGFGFLMVFLKHHSFSSISLNLFVAAWTMQITILCRGFWGKVFDEGFDHNIKIPIQSFGEADFGAGAVLISFGAVLGKVNAFQLMIMAVFEIIFYSLNQAIAVHSIKIVDIGGSMTIHQFGGFFGIMCSLALSNKECFSSPNLKDGTINNLIAMIGTVFLFMYWPSFNGLLVPDLGIQEMAFMNTLLSLSASVVVVFIFSALLNNGKFKMEDILNATLAGGVIIGGSADISFKPYESLLIGFIGGLISVVGFNYITPYLAKKLNFHDTCGVTNLHFLPGLVGGIVSAIMVSVTTDDEYNTYIAAYTGGREHSKQGGYQIIQLLITLGIAGASGFIVGKILKIKCLFNGPDQKHHLFTDAVNYHLAEDVNEVQQQVEMFTQGLTSQADARPNQQKFCSQKDDDIKSDISPETQAYTNQMQIPAAGLLPLNIKEPKSSEQPF